MDENAGDSRSKVAEAMWPALVKFIGKAHSRLSHTNMWMRNGAWNHGHPTPGSCSWFDDTTRLEDSLAAACKILYNLHTQMLVEMLVELQKTQGVDFLPDSSYTPHYELLCGEDKDSAAIARCILLACLALSQNTLFKLGLRVRFTWGKRPDLRRLTKAIKAPDHACWGLGVQELIRLSVLHETLSGNYVAAETAPREVLKSLLRHADEESWACEMWNENKQQADQSRTEARFESDEVGPMPGGE